MIISWSRRKYIYSSRIRYTMISFYIFGTMVRVKNIIPHDASFLLSDNTLVVMIDRNIQISSIDISYISTLLYIISYIIYIAFIPRDVAISLSRRDYVSRSIDSISPHNINDWFENLFHQISQGQFKLKDKILKAAGDYKDMCKSRLSIGSKPAIDDDVREFLKEILRNKYDYLNNDKYIICRIVIDVIVLVSFLLLIVAVADGIIKSIGSVIFHLY